MTLEIADGRGELFQWDTGRIIEFGEDAVSQAHFTSSEKVINIPYTVEVKNRKAAIPDELLQVPGKLIVYAWVSDTNGGYTKVQVNFPVFARPKPSDYVYTPTEHAGFDRLRTEIGDLSALTSAAKDNLVAAINEVAAEIPTVDSTLTQSGQAADAAVVGNRLSSLSKEIADLPQPDWNQNDGTQPDYIKNRPFYTGDPVETVLVEESTVSFADSGGLYMANFPSTFMPTIGETYKVYWDGTVYECICVNVGGPLGLGNLAIIGGGSDTGEPFIMGMQNGEKITIFTTDTSASHTFSISAFIPEIVKIDRKYLPKAAFITYDSSNGTYISDLANDELHEILLNGQQVVCLRSDKCKYLTEWTKKPNGRIELSFSGGLKLSLYNNGTIEPIS